MKEIEKFPRDFGTWYAEHKTQELCWFMQILHNARVVSVARKCEREIAHFKITFVANRVMKNNQLRFTCKLGEVL